MPGVTGLYGRRVSVPDPLEEPAPLGVNARTRPGGGDFIPDAAAAAAAAFPPRFFPLDFAPDFDPDRAPDAGPGCACACVMRVAWQREGLQR